MAARAPPGAPSLATQCLNVRCKKTYRAPQRTYRPVTAELLDIIRLEAGIERREPAQWDELRVWDPGDG